jgi:hypothetical protein
MLSLFGSRLPIDDDELEWQLATFKWLRHEFGSSADTPLVLPTPEWFPPTKAQGHERVRHLFDSVRAAAGLDQWPCELRPGEGDRPAAVGTGLLLRHEGAPPPCGTFLVEEEGGEPKAIVTYNPTLARDTTAMVATFAHELAHYVMSTAATAPPGGWELHELHTDLAAVYLGFGIFLANSARSFSQFQSAGEMGWSSRTQGYLSEAALVTATAVFQRLAGRDPLEAERWLKDYLARDLRKAAKGLAKRYPSMEAAVEAVDQFEFAGE